MDYSLELRNVSLRINQYRLANDISFQLQTGELACLLGPTGSGKSSVLRAIAGLISIDDGEILIGSILCSSTKKHVPTHTRQTTLVFQENTLFPHITLEENIRYGIKNWTLQNRNSRVNKLLKITCLEHKRTLYPHQLSGGELQRGAIARAMAPRPRIMLLDEPFSNQDTEIREELAWEVRQLLKSEQTTALMVTHNQDEAFALADKIGLLHHGDLVQWDYPQQLYHRPINRFAAEFVGRGSTIKGIVQSKTAVATSLGRITGAIDTEKFRIRQQVEVFLRPEDIEFNKNSRKKARVMQRRFRGTNYFYTFETIDSLEQFSCFISSNYVYETGDLVGLTLNVPDLILFHDYGAHP